MISILIPLYNNLDYLKKYINRIKKNFDYDQLIIIHIDDVNDKSLKYLKNNGFTYTCSKKNIGMPITLNINKKYFLVNKY